MTGVIGALVAFAIVLAIVLGLAVRPALRRLVQTAGAVRDDLSARLDRLATVRRARPARVRGAVVAPVAGPPTVPAGEVAAPSGAAAVPSFIGGRGRHRRVDGAP